MGKVSIAVEWVRLLADVSPAAAQLEVEASTQSEPDGDTAGLQDKETVLERHLGKLIVKVWQSPASSMATA